MEGRLKFPLVLIALAGIGAQIPSGTKFDVPFGAKDELAGYSTYTWNKSQVAVANLANHLRLINAVQEEMKELGYRIDTVKPDVLVRYRVERTTSVSTRSSQEPSPWDSTDLKVRIDVSREERVNLTIELTANDSNFLLWEGKGTYPLGSPDTAERQIQAAVADVFSRYPRPDEKK
jgi:hypothetical protein